MLQLSIGIIIGILLALVAMLAQKIGIFIRDIPKKFGDTQAKIVQLKDPLDEIEL